MKFQHKKQDAVRRKQDERYILRGNLREHVKDLQGIGAKFSKKEIDMLTELNINIGALTATTTKEAAHVKTRSQERLGAEAESSGKGKKPDRPQYGSE